MELLHLQVGRRVRVDTPRFAAEIALRSRELARAHESDRRRLAPGREHGRPSRLSRAGSATSAQKTGARALGA
jgi:hypothetical protein